MQNREVAPRRCVICVGPRPRAKAALSWTRLDTVFEGKVAVEPNREFHHRHNEMLAKYVICPDPTREAQ